MDNCQQRYDVIIHDPDNKLKRPGLGPNLKTFRYFNSIWARVMDKT